MIIETGKLAFQAHGAVTVRYGDSIVLATAVMSDRPRAEDVDFLPLTVGLRRKALFRWQDPRQLLPPGGSPRAGRHPGLPDDRPVHSPHVSQGAP